MTDAAQLPTPIRNSIRGRRRDHHMRGMSDMLIRFLATLGTPFVLFAALFEANDRRRA